MSYVIYTNVITFLTSIGYTVTDVIEQKQYDEIMKDKEFYIVRSDKKENKLSIIIIGMESIKSADIVKILNSITYVSDIYTIADYKLSSSIVKKIYEIKGKISYKNIEFTCFLTDIRKHIMTPKHEICSEQEKELFKNENYILSFSNIPYIFDTDPQIIWLNGKIGDLIKITRKKYHGELISYRVVIPT